MRKKTKSYMLFIFSIVFILGLGTFLFMQTPMFGKLPSGERLAKIKQSPNYKNGAFQNINPTPMLTEDASYWRMMKDFFAKSIKEPQVDLPSKKTDLLALDPSANVVIWMGHSSYFMQIDGKKILVDPVLCGYASPFSFSVKAYKGSDIYTTDDIPEIDYLIVTHDHWDHMDYKTLISLKPKVKKVICALGNGAHLERWGYNPSTILEEDWNKTLTLDTGFEVHVLPSRHFTGRGFKRNQTLWASFALLTPSLKIYIGGDSGYDSHFSEIGKQFGSFDLAILENGQYDNQWKYIHMMPHEVIKAANDLNAKNLLPVHSGKFTLANHDWDEPLSKIAEHSEQSTSRLITPLIGEQVNLTDSTQQFKQWWTELE